MNNGNNFLAYQVWIGLSKETRVELARIFELKPTGESVVHVGEIIGGNIAGVAKSDGFTAQDLQALTVEKLQQYLDTTDTNFYEMFNAVVADIESEDSNTEAKTISEEIVTPKPKKNGKKKN